VFTSISLIAVGAFVLTLGVVLYEVILLKKKKNTPADGQTIQLPDYQQDPKAVQTITAVSNVGEPQVVPQAAVATAPVQTRSLPSKKILFGIGAVFMFVILALVGMVFMSSSSKSKKTITQAPVDSPTKVPSPKPTRAQIVIAQSPTPTITVSIIIESETDKPASESGTNNPTSESGTNGSDKGTSASGSATISPSASPSATITSAASPSAKVTSSTTPVELPQSGVIHQSIVLGVISLAFILIAFAL